MSYRMNSLLRTLCLASVAFGPMAAVAQDAGAPAPGNPAAAAVAPAAAAPQTAAPVAGAPIVPGTEPDAGKPGEQVIITGNTTGVAAIVNDFVISNYDLDQRTALFVATSGVRTTRENLTQIRAQVLRSLVDEVLELKEAQKHKIIVSKAEVDKALQSIAEDNKLTVDKILETIGRAGVTGVTFRQQINAQLTWQKLVSAKYGSDIQVSEQQVDEVLNRLKAGGDKPQFLVSEIFVAVDRPEDETTIKVSIDQIAQQIGQGAAFQTVAGQFSQSPSAADGGDIGWVVQGQLADDLDHALADIRPGQITKPIRAEGGYYILQLRDRREPIGTKIEEPKTAAAGDADAAIPLDRLLIPLPPNADASIRDRALMLANNVKMQVRACSDLPAVAMQLQGTVYTKLGTPNPKDLSPDLRAALAKAGPGEAAEPFFSPAGLELIMRCDEAPPKLVAFELPSRAELQQQLFVQQMGLYAKSYLRDLRRDAVVETR